MEAVGAPRLMRASRLAVCAGRWSAWVSRVGTKAAVVTSVNAGSLTEDRSAPFGSFGNCALRMLAEGLQSARLETRTKESNMYASRWVANP